MGLFSWLSGLFGRKKANIPDRIVEFRNRPRAKSAGGPAAATFEPRERQQYMPREEVKPASGGKDYFDLAGDRAERERAAKEAEAAASQPEQAYMEPEEPEVSIESAAEVSVQAEGPAPETDDDYSPLDLAREISGGGESAPQTYEEPEYLKVDQSVGAIEQEAPSVEAEPDFGQTESAVIELGGEPAQQAEPEPVEAAPVEEPKPAEPERAPDPELAGGTIDDEHALETLDVETVEGQGTVTIERKRIETKTINVAGEPFELAIYEYQNSTRAVRVPRAAIDKMTDVAKANNLKVLPRRQNAAIMAGRYLDVPRAKLQELAEQEKYHLVDFTDTYYEICFGDLPQS